MSNIDFAKLKLIIWDLDDTFWKGTLSEGPVEGIPENISLLQSLTDHGVVNSVCSKNECKQTIAKLEELRVNNLFVFKSIDWTPKGQRISKLIKNMGLRPVNCLFLDDNIVNLNEAKYYEKDLMIAEPTIIPGLIAYFDNLPASDLDHKRLKNYQVLELKQLAKEHASDNMEFLYSSNTKVEIKHDCLAHLDRIYELVNRTNQLNYTKLRSSKEEIEQICQDRSFDVGYVEVSDRFGEYGIVGFYAVQNHKCLHFLFSCRTIGQGVEQFVYAMLNYPQLEVVGEVVNPVTKDPIPKWINQTNSKHENGQIKEVSHKKIVLKGGCDLKIMTEYLQTDNIIEEFTYISPKRHNLIENQNHSTNYLQWPFLNIKERKQILEECVFADEAMFDTAIYDKDVAIAFVSTLSEANLGIYRRKTDGFCIAFGEACYPLTDPRNWDLYIKKKIFDAYNNFTSERLKSFSDKYDFIGSLSPENIIQHAKELLAKTPLTTKVCFILGSETPFDKNTQENYNDRHLINKEINDLFRTLSKENNRVLLIDINNFIKGQDDFTNNINHYHRRVYYQIATKANQYIETSTGTRLKQKSLFYFLRKDLIDRIGYTGFYQTKLWGIIRKPYIIVKRLLYNIYL